MFDLCRDCLASLRVSPSDIQTLAFVPQLPQSLAPCSVVALAKNPHLHHPSPRPRPCYHRCSSPCPLSVFTVTPSLCHRRTFVVLAFVFILFIFTCSQLRLPSSSRPRYSSSCNIPPLLHPSPSSHNSQSAPRCSPHLPCPALLNTPSITAQLTTQLTRYCSSLCVPHFP